METKEFNLTFKAFWGKGKKPSLFNFDAAGVGNTVEVRGASLADKEVVIEKLNKLFSTRPSLKYGDLKYDSEYSTFSSVVLSAGRAGQKL